MFTPLPDGAVLQNRYRIVSRLDKPNQAGKGKGNMGAVYLAEDVRLRSEVAVKQTYVGDVAELGRAFQREAALLANLKHPALPKVIDYFLEGDGQFLVMELIRGDDLDDVRVKHGGRLPVEMAIKLADQLLETLDFLHTQPKPIIHRDIKPSNLKLTERGQLMLLDFGIAKGSSGLMTEYEGSVQALTPAYAPPEQLEGEGTEARSDLYSMAATLYHLLTGSLPPHALAVRARNLAIGKPDALRSIHELNPAVSPEISAVFQKALSLDIEKRPASAAAMREELNRAKETVPPEPVPPPKPPPGNQFWETAGGLGILLLLGAMFLWYVTTGKSGDNLNNRININTPILSGNNSNSPIPPLNNSNRIILSNINYNSYINANANASPAPTSVIGIYANLRTINSNVAPPPVITTVGAAHNIFENGKKGVRISADLNAVRYQKIPLQIKALFYKAGSNEKLTDRNGRYKTESGAVAAETLLSPDEFAEKVSVFLPYEELELGNGQHELTYVVEVWFGVVMVGQSRPYSFTYTQSALGALFGENKP